MIAEEIDEDFTVGRQTGEQDARMGRDCRFKPNHQIPQNDGSLIVTNTKEFHSHFAAGYYSGYKDYQQNNGCEYDEARAAYIKRMKG